MAQYASQGYVQKDGVTIASSSSIEVDQATNNADVDTILDGFVGNTVGTKKYTVKLSNPIPAAGFDVNWMTLCEESATHQLRFVLLRPVEAGGGSASAVFTRRPARAPRARPSAGARCRLP